MVDLFDGKSAQDNFEPVVNVADILKKLKTLDPEDAERVLRQVDEAVKARESAGNILTNVLKIVGTAAGFIL